MRLMMPPRAGRGWGAEGGGGASSWVVCGVGATAWASPQTAVAALGGVGSASGGKSGAPTSAHCGRRREVWRSRPFSALAHAHIAARSWLIVSDQAIPHRLTVAHFGFRPPAWCRSTPPSQQLASDLAAVFRPARTPDGQNAGLPPPPPTGLVIIASGTLDLPGVRLRSAASWPRIAWCRSTPSSLRAFRPGFQGRSGLAWGLLRVTGGSRRPVHAHIHPGTGMDRSAMVAHRVGAVCASPCLSCVCLRARLSQVDSSDLGACMRC